MIIAAILSSILLISYQNTSSSSRQKLIWR